MSSEARDLSALSRGALRPAGLEPHAAVPPPRFHWRTRVLLPGAILAVTAGMIAYSARESLWIATPVRVTPVIVKADTQSQPAGSVVVQAPGWVEADPFPTAVSALTDGVVAEVLVLEGQRVEAGQVVCRLVDDDARISLAHAEAMLAEREAALEAARAALAEAQQNWDHPIELERKLRTAEARLAEARAELDRWPSELAREQAREIYLKAEAERVAGLHERGSASEIELIQARQAHAAQQAEVEATRRRRPILEAQARSLEAEVAAAADNLRLRIADMRALAEAKAALQRAEAAVASARALRDEAALRLERTQVRSPAAGVVMVRLVEPGSKLMLSSDDPRSAQVLRLYDPARLQVRVDIPLVDAAKVGVGQPAEIMVDVLPERVFRGRITRVVHEADVQKNTLQVKVAIEQPSSELKPEMLARARFLSMAPTDGGPSSRSAAATQRCFVPKSALLTRDGRSCVWLADQVSRTARLQPVTSAAGEIDGWVAVSEGLQAGDRVIIDAPPDLRAGQRIEPIEE